ncbi:prolipoprotein diacylglyceryl transferase [bacterium]|nr:prolipoprotein diacylglyceryl transferase [bacterium]
MDPILISFNGFQIRYFGVLLAFGLVIMFIKVRRNFLAIRLNLTREETLDWFLITFIYGVVGARIYFVLFNLDYYFNLSMNWYEVFAIWHGGLSFHGGVIFAAFSFWSLCRNRKIPFGVASDQVVAPILIVQAFACIGSFVNGELLGTPTNSRLGIIFEYGPAAELYPNIRVHPAWIYCALLYLVGFLFIDIMSKGRLKDGFATTCYLLWYSLVQLLISFVRTPGLTLFGADETLIMSIAGVVVSIGLIVGKRLYRKPPLGQKQFPSTRKWST